MKTSLLSRYERNPDGSFVIDVSATQAEDLYSNFDKSAPYIRRDLDQHLVDYLIECARELDRAPFSVRLSLQQSPDEARQSRIRSSINAYFVYLVQAEQRNIRQMLRRAAILLGIGLVILFLAVSVNQALGQERSVVADVFAEGLTVAAWVSLWEAIAVFLIEWFPHRKNISLFRRLADVSLQFSEGGS